MSPCPLVGEQSSAGGFFMAEMAGLEPATRCLPSPALPTELHLILTNLFFFCLGKQIRDVVEQPEQSIPLP